MTDPRALKSNGRVAHISLRGQVTADRFVQGEVRRIVHPLTDLLRGPDGARERQLLLGERFCVLDEEDRHAFGFADRDGYVGYVHQDALVAGAPEPSHIVAVPRSYAKGKPALKSTEPVTLLAFGARLAVGEVVGGWARVERAGADWFVPAAHLAPADTVWDDHLSLAQSFLGTPYLWGGNSAYGIDCSGLVQAVLLACGIACPGDSDQQARAIGSALPATALAARGDLYFWGDHVGIVADPGILLHANAHAMAVALEPLGSAIERIRAQGDGEVTARRRISSRRG